ncbi:DUF6049 family protein [Rathayibacter sp. YIM 133350]|uniref:DUF6049 family protein n=1 Tax=Rathayibacter sp. YIM 133350 TaxID=3131992 RepID=UPI00307E29C9
MTAVTTPAPRPAVDRRRRPWTTRIASAVGAAALALLTLAAPPATAQAATENVTLSVATASPTLAPGQDLQVSIAITNAGSAGLDAGTVAVSLHADRIGTRGALDAWLDGADEPGSAAATVTVPTPRLLPAGNALVQATIPAASVGLDGKPWGVHGISAVYTAAGDAVASEHGTVTWYSGEGVEPTPLAVTMALTAPPGSTGLLSAEDLTALTRPGGLLTRELDGVVGFPAAVGIDPMILASIRALGTAAPPSATEWLDRLEGLTNESFALSYADADVAAQAQAQLPALLGPTSFGFALDPADFPPPTSAPGSPTPTSTVTPTATAAPTSVPTTEQLLAWNYTLPGIAWPAQGTLVPGDLAAFTASGLGTTIVGSGQVADAGSSSPRAAASVGDARAAVSDDRLARSLSRAETAATDTDWRAAIDEASAVLAVSSGEGSTAPVLAALDRGWPPTSTRLPETLGALTALPWVAPTTLGTALAAPPTAIAIKGEGESASRVSAVKRLIDGEGAVSTFATVLADPATLTGDERLRVLGLLAVGWLANAGDWDAAVAEHATATANTLASVSIAQSSEVLVLGSPAHIPVGVRNDFSQPVTVRVQAVPSNGRLVVDDSVEATIDAGSSATVKIPVSSQIGSGEVVLTIRMFSSTGAQIGSTSWVTANVQADWEGLGALTIGAIAVVFFGVGVWRNIRRRRRARAAEGVAPDASPSATEASTQDAAAGVAPSKADANSAPADAAASHERTPSGD